MVGEINNFGYINFCFFIYDKFKVIENEKYFYCELFKYSLKGFY